MHDPRYTFMTKLDHILFFLFFAVFLAAGIYMAVDYSNRPTTAELQAMEEKNLQDLL